MYKIQFEDENGVAGETIVDDVFIKIMKETKFIERSLKAQITACFIYMLKDTLPKGDLAELGVYRGGITKFMSALFPDKTVYAFDTFEGMPEEMITDKDIVEVYPPGKFDDVEDVLKYLDEPNIEIRKGLFPNTTQGLEDKKFSFVHLDADLYESTMTGLEFFWPRMTKKGVIIFDDFECPNTPGVKLAFDDYFKNSVLVQPLLKDRGVVMVRKTTP